METREEYAYGIVPLRKRGDQIEVFLIHQYGSRGDMFWGIPKGHQEEGETPLETAKREVFEEIGLRPSVEDDSKMYEIRYEFDQDGVHIKKCAGYFVGWVDDGAEVSLQEDEIKEAKWFPIEGAYTQFTFPRYVEILQQVIGDLDNT